MNFEIITDYQREKRNYWINEISHLSGNFGEDSQKVEQEIAQEIQSDGIETLLGHLRLCGVIPEKYGHDTTEEKLYSKYTDVVIHEAFKAIGLNSIVLQERSGVADVECVTQEYSFVADAKAFRLSRTAKNQKDFKVQALDNWKHGKPYAMLVCPDYQLPARSSQIYQQAVTRSVFIATYTHLAVLVRYAITISQNQAMVLLQEVFKSVEAMNPSKNANSYWQVINRIFLDSDKTLSNIWKDEKQASIESISISKEEALIFLSQERERIMRMSKAEAIKELIKINKIDHQTKAVNSVASHGLLDIL
ncbi:MAG: HindIII family type II restriction endonuclease [Halothece sp.]